MNFLLPWLIPYDNKLECLPLPVTSTQVYYFWTRLPFDKNPAYYEHSQITAVKAFTTSGLGCSVEIWREKRQGRLLGSSPLDQG
jgi:hypothetical protein